MRDPINAAQWTGSPVDYMQGEDRKTGKIWHVRGWHKWGDKKKVRHLRKLAQEYGGDPHMRWFTVQRVLRPYGVEPRDYKRSAEAILHYVQHQIYYTNEPGEQIQSPWATIREQTGDCDDMALLACSMAESIRLNWRLVLSGTDRRGRPVRWADGTRFPRGARFSHIYYEIGFPPFAPPEKTTWLASEPTIRGLPLGYDAAVQGVPQHMRGGHDLGGLGYGNALENAANAAVDEAKALEEARIARLEVYRPLRVWRSDGILGVLGLLPWGSILTAVIEGTLTALVLEFILRRAIKKKGRR